MIKITLTNGLPFVSATLRYQGNTLDLSHALLDTGSGGTVFAADRLLGIGILPEPQDALRRIASVGGAEYVFEKKLDELRVGPLVVHDFPIEVGALDYGFQIEGILGVDFLRTVGAIIDLKHLTLSAS